MQENSANRSELLDVLSEVKTRVMDKLGHAEFPIPQFIVLGKQSVGKSRLVEALAGEQFNFVSGTLGSRRPTVLEFRHVASLGSSHWSVRNSRTQQWEEHNVDEVMRIVGEAHESLGATCSSEPCNVRIESPHCVDMQIVDLPGFRSFASTDDKKVLAEGIDRLNRSFMTDDRNVMICVEEAGDASNLQVLSICKQYDPHFKRTVLVRNKLDKYYDDLTGDNVNDWLQGFGDLPPNLKHFALTLPHWGTDRNPSTAEFVEMRKNMAKDDEQQLSVKGASDVFKKLIGFNNFTPYMEKRIHSMFAQSIGPVLRRCKELLANYEERQTDLAIQLEETDERIVEYTVRSCGGSFSAALTPVMEGQLGIDESLQMGMEEELRQFHEYHKSIGSTFKMLPSEEFGDLDSYIEYLQTEAKVDKFKINVSGGAQFTRMLQEVEIFIRFAEMPAEVKKKDVIQARGVSMGSVTWGDVVVKILLHHAHLPMKDHVTYAGERIKWFFVKQKDVVINWMRSLQGSSQEHMYSSVWTKHVRTLENDQMVKHLVFQAYDKAVNRQLEHFTELFANVLDSIFANPWAFLKRASSFTDYVGADDHNKIEACLPSFEDTKARIPAELAQRSGNETFLAQWIAQVPQEQHLIDEAVDRVQMLVLKTHAIIRSQVSDQIELYSDSFFKLPMMRRLPDDMGNIVLQDSHKKTCVAMREKLKSDHELVCTATKDLGAVIEKLQTFAIKNVSIRE